MQSPIRAALGDRRDCPTVLIGPRLLFSRPGWKDLVFACLNGAGAGRRLHRGI